MNTVKRPFDRTSSHSSTAYVESKREPVSSQQRVRGGKAPDFNKIGVSIAKRYPKLMSALAEN
jgi:hypothetical protein